MRISSMTLLIAAAAMAACNPSKTRAPVTTTDNAPLIVTARTYDDAPDGTVGQFVPAVTPQEAVGVGERPLEILQTEESVRFRTNFGLAEVTGKPAVVEGYVWFAKPVIAAPTTGQ